MARRKLRGLTQTKREVNAYIERMGENAKDLMREAGREMALEAERQVPVDTGDLRRSITHEVEESEGHIEVRVRAGVGLEAPEVAAYVEFGTGSKVRIPAGLERYARRWYVNGKGFMPASPYFFPAFERIRGPLIRDLRKLSRRGLSLDLN